MKNGIKEILKGAKDENKSDMRSILNNLFPDFLELHGDRASGDDSAIITGITTIKNRALTIISTQKGKDLNERIKTHFGSPTPSGYKKALRIMKLSERFKIPILTLINTPGAYPDKEAEDSGQGQIISKSISQMLGIKVPTISIIVGEAGSGGALALACSDAIWSLEYSTYTILSPEGFAAIMWHDSHLALKAAKLMHIDPMWLKENNIIDEVIPENNFFDSNKMITRINEQLECFSNISLNDLMEQRKSRFRSF